MTPPNAPTASEREGEEPADRYVAVLTGPDSPERSRLLNELIKFGEPQDLNVTVASIVRRLLSALLAARRGERALRDALDAVYVERYGITYQELEQRIRDVQNGEFLTHEEAMQRIRAALAAAQGDDND